MIEYHYTLVHAVASNFPAWYFQNEIPTRYSQFSTFFDSSLKFNALKKISKPFYIDTTLTQEHIWAMNNMPSSKKEAYMRAPDDARESIALLLTTVNFGGQVTTLDDNWSSIGRRLANEKDYYKELDQRLEGESKLLSAAADLKTDDGKIAYLFNTVKNAIEWNGMESWGPKDGIKAAWKKKSGNSAEVNAILYHLLKRSGIKAYPMLVSTRENGLLEPQFTNVFQINGLVTFIPVDSIKCYVLDATNKYNTYNQIPFNLLNSYGLCLNKEADKYDMFFIEERLPARENFLMTAEIGTDGKMRGQGQIVSSMYNKSDEVKLFKTAGEEKFKQYLTGNDNNIIVSNLKMENMGVDTLPLKQSFDFTDDLNNSENYLFLNPDMFIPFHDNPFLSETRNAEIDFGYKGGRIINSRIKLPEGYKVESIPQNINIVAVDKTMRFQRSLELQDGYVTLHYEMSYKRSRYSTLEYADLREFFKKMLELLNEQIVLKKI